MNKSFWLGLSMLSIQVIIILLVLLSSLNWSWITVKLVNQIMFAVALLLYNITALVVMIRGMK